MSNLITYLGENSYPAIVESVRGALMNSSASTMVGEELLKKAFQNFNESTTPILQLKEFTTNAEVLAPNDAKLGEIVDFVRKKVKSGDTNFLINLCKEEHIANLTRAGFPTPEATIKAYEAEFNEPSSIVEAAINKGIFDNLESNLLMQIKTDLNPSKNPVNTAVEKGQVNLFENVAIYKPIGIRYETEDKIMLLTESDVIEISGDGSFNSVSNDIVDVISLPYKRLMQAIQSVPYNPETTEFSIDGKWDFEMKLLPNGKVIASVGDVSKEIVKEDIPKLLLECVNDFSLNPNYDKLGAMKFADDFIMLVENSNKLIELDQLKVIRNLSTNDYVILHESANLNKIVVSSNKQIVSDSFTNLNESIKTTIGTKTNLFESQIVTEQQTIMQNIEQKQQLLQEQSDLNLLIEQNEKLQKMAEDDSPAKNQLSYEHTELMEALKVNLDNLKRLWQDM